MKTLAIFSMLVLSACTYSGHEGPIGQKSCPLIKKECIEGVYSEWFQANDEIACTCSGQ